MAARAGARHTSACGSRARCRPTTTAWSRSRFLGQVRQALHRELTDRLPTLASTARGLRLSARTLQRRLADEGATFQELVESVRFERARTLLDAGRLGVGQIALELHFSDVSSFVRAYRGVTGETPGSRRAAGRDLSGR